MFELDKFLKKLTSQIKGSSVKLPKNPIESPKIQDNNQAINNGVINEESNISLRSTGKTRAGRKRSPKS